MNHPNDNRCIACVNREHADIEPTAHRLSVATTIVTLAKAHRLGIELLREKMCSEHAQHLAFVIEQSRRNLAPAELES